MANIGYGSNSYVKFDFEDATWGVDPGAPDGRKIAFVSESIKGSQGLIQNEALSGDPNPRDPVLARVDCSGDIVLQPGIISMPHIMKWITSNLATAGAADPWTHTSKLQSGAAVSVCLETLLDLDTDLFKKANGLIVESFGGEVGPDGILRFTLGVVGKTAGKATTSFHAASTKDYTAETVYHHGHILAADCKVNGSANTRLLGLSWNMNLNPMKDVYGVGQAGVRLGVGRGRASLTGTIRMYVDDATIWDLANAGTYTSLDLTWTQTASTRTFQLQFPRILLSKTDPAIGNDGPIVAEFNFVGAKDGTAQSAIVMVCKTGYAATEYA